MRNNLYLLKILLKDATNGLPFLTNLARSKAFQSGWMGRLPIKISTIMCGGGGQIFIYKNNNAVHCTNNELVNLTRQNLYLLQL